MSALPVLEARRLSRTFRAGRSWFGPAHLVQAVDGVDLAVQPAETLAIVGESGSGKSTLGRLLLGLLRPTEGEVRYGGRDLAGLGAGALRALRRELQLIFQDPFSSLNPRLTVGALIEEPLWVHGLGSAGERRAQVADLLARVGLRPEHAGRYPHEFSGGQRQRIGIARALASGPRLVVGDEPVSALDVSVQAQVINLLEELKAEFGLTLVIIAHDLAVIRHMSDRVAVMYLGEIVELAPNDALFERPLHPYSRALLAAIPVADPTTRRKRTLLEGDPPNPLAPPPGCRFHVRCPMARQRCRVERPVLRRIAAGREAACHFSEEMPEKAPHVQAEPQPSADHAYFTRARRFALYREAQARREAAEP